MTTHSDLRDSTGTPPAAPAAPVERARRLAPAIMAASEETEALRTMPQRIVALLDEANLFGLLVPEELGGAGADLLTAIEVIEELCKADASTGWTYMANVILTGHVAGYVSDGAAQRIYRESGTPILAGLLAPMGTARSVPGGYLIKGSYSFGSGSGHANWIGGGARWANRDGREADLVFVVPREQVVFKDNWCVVGLAGTGSYDYEIPQQFVPEDFAFERGGTPFRRGQSSLRLDLPAFGSAGHVGVALGIGTRALTELVALVSAGKRRPNAVPVIEQQMFLHDFALYEGRLAAARSFAFDVYGAAIEAVAGGDPLDGARYQRIRQATTLTCRAAYDVVEFAYRWSGSVGMRHPHPLGRLMRDMHAATQHASVDTTTLVAAGSMAMRSYAACR